MPYVYFSDEQKLRANSVDLEEYLARRGEKLVRSGPEKRLTSDHSITVRGSPTMFQEGSYTPHTMRHTCAMHATNEIPFRQVPNRGQKPKYFVEDCHEPISSKGGL